MHCLMWSCPRLQNFLNNYMSQPFRLVWRTSLRTSSMMFNDGLILAIKCTKPLRDVRGKKFQSPMLSCCVIDISLLEHNAGNTQFYLKHEMWPIVDRRLCVLNEIFGYQNTKKLCYPFTWRRNSAHKACKAWCYDTMSKLFW